ARRQRPPVSARTACWCRYRRRPLQVRSAPRRRATSGEIAAASPQPEGPGPCARPFRRLRKVCMKLLRWEANAAVNGGIELTDVLAIRCLANARSSVADRLLPRHPARRIAKRRGNMILSPRGAETLCATRNGPLPELRCFKDSRTGL